MARKRLSSSKIDVRGIPKELRELPVGFGPDGSMVSLMDILNWPEKDHHVVHLEHLPKQKLVDLAVKRLEMQKELGLGRIGEEPLSKERAIAEVRNRTPLGDAIVDVEKYMIQYVWSIVQPKS